MSHDIQHELTPEHARGIGRCELCGLVDHHLAAGICAECETRCTPLPAHTYPCAEEAARQAALHDR